MSEIKDFIYLDTDKVSSLYSQISGGLIQSVESLQSNTENNKNLRNYSFKVFKHEAGGTTAESNQLKETRVSHHEVYNELESELFKHGYAAELGIDISPDDVRSGEATDAFESVLCVKAEGSIVFEDYERITRIAENYEVITGFINNSVVANIKESPAYLEIHSQIEASKLEIKAMKNGPQKN